ncbi:MAG: T9SS type A sorting domain-containing protein [Bacteroidota bacterium]
MKKQMTIFSKYAILLLLITCWGFAKAANDPTWPKFNLEIRNDVQVDSKNYEFDVYIVKTDTVNYPVALDLQSIQLGIFFNAAIINGGTISATIVPGSTSEITPNQRQTNANVSIGASTPNKTIRVTSISSTDITSITTVGTKILRLRLTNTVAFASDRPNLTWSFSNPPSLPTKVNSKIGTTNITLINGNGTFINANSTNSVATNPILNPTIFTMTGGGIYCPGSLTPVTVGLSSSQSGVSYQLKQDGNNYGLAVSGTGSSLSWNITQAGTYTCVPVGSSIPMNGSSVVTLSTPVTLSLTIEADNVLVCQGTAINFTAHQTNGGASPTFDWTIGGVLQSGHGSTYQYTGAPTPSSAVQCKMTASSEVCASPNMLFNTNPLSITINPSLSPSVAIEADYLSVCEGTAINFTAHPTNGGSNPVYNWYVGGVQQSGHGSTLQYIAPSSFFDVFLEMVSNENCVSPSLATSNTLHLEVKPIPAISSTTPGSHCGTGTVNLSASASLLGSSLNWYDFSGNLLYIGSSFTTPTISSNTNYYVDASKNGCTTASRTEVLATINTIPTVISASVTPNSLCGSGTVLFDATASAGTIKWYDGLGTLVTPPNSVSSSTTLYAEAVSPEYCISASRTSVTVTVNTLPTVVSASATPNTICGSGSVVFAATASSGIIKWYDGSGNVVTPPNAISTTTTFFAEAVSPELCVSTSRTPVTATVNNIPTVLSASVAPATLCGSGSVLFAATPSAGTIKWYDGLGNLVSPPTTISSTTTLYAEAVSPEFCVSISRTEVTVTVNTLPTVVSASATPSSICGSGSVLFDATASLGTIKWYDGSGNVVTPPTTINSTTTLYAEAVSPDLCVSISRSSVTATVNPIVTATITLSASANPVITGNQVTFTPTIQSGYSLDNTNTWYVNGSPVAYNIPSYTYSPINGDVVYFSGRPIPQPCPGFSNSNSITMTVNEVNAYNVTGSGTFCAAAVVSLSGSQVGVPYQLKKDGQNYGSPLTGNGLALTWNVTQSGTYTCVSNAVNMNGSAVIVITTPTAASVVIAADNLTPCAGLQIHLTVTPTNGGTYPTYNWYRDGVLIYGTTQNTITLWAYNSSSIYCKMTSSLACVAPNPAQSNTITYISTPNVTPSVTITADRQTVCAGSPINLTAVPVNGGSTPSYDWYVGGIVQSSHLSTLQIAPNLSSNVYCKMTSSVICVTANNVQSNTINFTTVPNVTPSVSINASALNVCAGSNIIFTATPTNGGTTPSFNWYLGGSLISGGTSTFVNIAANSSSNVYCTMNSQVACVSANNVQSNILNFIANPIVSPTVNISASANPITTGTSVTFTPTIQSGYTVSAYNWFKNSINVASSATYTYSPSNGDQIYVKLTFNESCTSQSSSNTVVMNVVTSLPTVVTYGITNNVYTGVTLNGSVNVSGGDPNVERGFIWSTNSAPTELNGTKVTASTLGLGSYSKAITGLTPNTYYYVKAYATNMLGTTYGAVVQFDTRNVTVFTGTGLWSDASKWSNGIPIAASTAFINGTCTATSDGICNSLGVYPTASLTINANVTITTNIYLLVYSDATGTGAIVQQGTLNVTAPNSTIFQRYITASATHLISSPLSNAKSGIFTGAFLRSFNEPTGAYSANINATSVSLSVGKGFSLSSTTAKTFQFSGGTLNKDDVTISTISPSFLQYSGAAYGYNLIGNPYPCRLDLHNSNNWVKTNVSSTFMTWNPTLNNYDTWNGVTGTNMLASGVVAETQGFFVQTIGATPSITIPASAQTASYSNNFKNVIPNLIRLNVKGNGSSDEMIVYFDQNATKGKDNKFDVEKLYGSEEAPQLFSFTTNNNLSINCLPEVNSNVTVPIGLKVGANTKYTITASELESFNAGINIYLEDLKLNKMINLNEKPTYTFDANSNDVVNRFMLHFGNPTSINTSLSINAYTFDNTLYINNPSLVNINEVVIYNTLGQVVNSFKPEITSLKGYNVNASAGSYIVKLVTDNNVISNKVNLK